MIDMHVHLVHPQIPGVLTVPDVILGRPEEVAAWFRQEVHEAGVTHALGMGHLNGSPDDPLGIRSTLTIAELVPGVHPIGIADPTRTDADHLGRVEKQLQSGKVKALKAYLGYTHFGPDSRNYYPYYELAAHYGTPFIFHTGDNYSTAAKVKFAHPLLVDEVAVDFRGVQFVMAHLGNPWFTDAAEVLYKNPNVWADLSGILIGDDDCFRAIRERGAMGRVAGRIRDALEFADCPDRVLYGSDWPLARLTTYRDFIRDVVPKEHHQAVFEDNARRLFRL
jgi:predicted TIM-barrel fold metal-dependent hydrolase